MKLRPAAIALALAAAVALLLSGCDSKTGAAAVVGDTQISMSDVDDYVFALDEDQLALTQFGTTDVQLAVARNLVLRFSIAAEITTQALAELGLDPTPGELQAAHDEGLTYVFAQNPENLSGDAADAEAVSQLEGLGVDSSFLDTILLYGEQMAIIADELNLSGTSAVGSAIGDMGIDVDVNPRFGTWSFEQMSLVGGPVVPPFVTSGTSAAVAS